MKITEPGIYFDVPIGEYFADPCPEPSITQSIAKILIERSPLHAWNSHPRLNPDFKRDDHTKFDIGNIAHSLLIGRGKDVVSIPFDDWRTNAAKAEREALGKEGKLAVLGKHYLTAIAMVAHAKFALSACDCPEAFRLPDGQGEVVLIAHHRGMWLRSMVDWLSDDRTVIYDYKTTGISVAPHNIGNVMANAGWDVQAAMQEFCLTCIEGAKPRIFRFVAQENEPPYATIVCELSEATMTMGRKKLYVAMNIWSRCLAENRWPGYATGIVFPDYPPWSETSWLNREQTEFVNLLEAG